MTLGPLDLDRLGPPPTSGYLIAATARSGSTLLCRALESTGVLGHPTEFLGDREEARAAAEWGLDWPGSGVAALLEAASRAGTTPNGTFGTKLHGDAAWRIGNLLPEVALQTVDGRVRLGPCPLDRVVHLRRHDKVAAAMSEWWAETTGQWQLEPGTEPSPHGDPPAVDELTALHEYQHMWDHFWLGSRVLFEHRLEIWFEDLVGDFDRTLARVCAFLGAPDAKVQPAALPLAQPDPDRASVVAGWAAATGGCAECGVSPPR